MDHIQFALETREEESSIWDDISFAPNSLPNISYGNCNLAASLPPLLLSSPLLINAMTGGAPAVTAINQKLAVIARERGLAMAVGSQMAALRDPAVRESYHVVRRENPKGMVFANLGAEATVEQAVQAVEMIEANGLQIHLNVMQELLMPEGDRDFRGYLDNIRRIKEHVGVPVIVKEVGFGMSAESMEKLADAGITLLDVGGRGGTNFAKVENRRITRRCSCSRIGALQHRRVCWNRPSFNQGESLLLPREAFVMGLTLSKPLLWERPPLAWPVLFCVLFRRFP
jgi:isopentenyl-diphosphate delta-isomerase